jgi:hypothetical protein
MEVRGQVAGEAMTKVIDEELQSLGRTMHQSEAEVVANV